MSKIEEKGTQSTQHKNSLLVKLIKKILSTKIGKSIAYKLGVRGFNHVGWEVERNGKVVQTGSFYNSRVDIGADLSASLFAGADQGSATSAAAPKYLALSTSTLTPAKGDTTLTGETSASGLGRTAATIQNYSAPSSLNGACSYEAYNEFTNGSGGAVEVKSTALLDAASGGNLFVEANFSNSANLEDSDVLKVTWTVNL